MYMATQHSKDNMIDLGCKDDDIKVTPSFSFNNDEPQPLPTPKRSPRKMALEQPPSFNNWDHEKTLEPSLSFNMQGCRPTLENEAVIPLPVATAEVPLYRLLSPRPKSELDECATKLQKYYRSYRTRRNLADAAVIIEEYWWNQALSENWWHALDYASLNINSVSFYHHGKTEKAVSRWSRAKKRLAKVGKGLSKDQKARKLALQHWLEAIDPRHRYGHNLHLYYDFWFNSESTQPFFYWLDCGDGKKVDLRAKCPRSRLQTQLIKYLGPTERESYEVVVVGGRLIYKKEDVPVSTSEDSKWIFVLSTSRNLYVGQKRKGTFQHSSFLAGAATTAAGRLVAKDGFLKAIWPYSGHYLPTDENFREFIDFLVHNSVDMSGVKRCSVDDDEYPSFKKPDSIEISTSIEDSASTDISTSSTNETDSVAAGRITPRLPSTNSVSGIDTSEAGRFTPRWSTGTGARITCVRDYPPELQKKALEHVKLSPRTTPSVVQIKLPIPSPRPSPGMRPSPQLSRLGFSPRVFAADLQVRDVANGSPKFIISPIRNRIPAASPRRSPVSKLSPSAPFVGFHCPKVTLRLPSKKGRRALRKAES